MKKALKYAVGATVLSTLASMSMVRFAIHRDSAGNTLRKVSMDNLAKKCMDKDSPLYRVHLCQEQLRPLVDAYREECPEFVLEAKSFDGVVLKGFLRKCEGSRKYVIAFHGYRATHREIDDLGFGLGFHRLGFNVLSVDQRASGESGGKYIGMGWLERKDALAWIDVVKKMDPEAYIVLFGESMGAATVLAAGGEELPSNVKAIVSDSGYADVYSTFRKTSKHLFHVSGDPIILEGSLLSRLVAGYGFKDADIAKALSHCALPVLLFHGEKDSMVSFDNLGKLYEAKKTGYVEKHAVAEADHVTSVFFLGQEYWDIIDKFLQDHA